MPFEVKIPPMGESINSGVLAQWYVQEGAKVKMGDPLLLIRDIDPQFNATQCLFSTETYISHLKSGNDTILQLYDQDVISSASVLHGAGAAGSRGLRR